MMFNINNDDEHIHIMLIIWLSDDINKWWFNKMIKSAEWHIQHYTHIVLKSHL